VSDDPHAPTSAGPDPEEARETVEGAEAAPAAGDQPGPEPAAVAEEPAAAMPPAPEAAPVVPPAPEPTPVVPPSESSWRTPPGTAAPTGPASGAGPRPRPEIDLAKAFAGGVVAALLLKAMGR